MVKTEDRGHHRNQKPENSGARDHRHRPAIGGPPMRHHTSPLRVGVCLARRMHTGALVDYVVVGPALSICSLVNLTHSIRCVPHTSAIL
ncbi:hypothetical protein V6N13_004905 [Hibiscus sabdariffa]